jgi:hypothetical protein
MKSLTGLVSLLLVTIASCNIMMAAEARPNIVVIVADDLG